MKPLSKWGSQEIAQHVQNPDGILRETVDDYSQPEQEYSQDFERGMLARIMGDLRRGASYWVFVWPIAAIIALAVWVIAVHDAIDVCGKC